MLDSLDSLPWNHNYSDNNLEDEPEYRFSRLEIPTPFISLCKKWKLNDDTLFHSISVNGALLGIQSDNSRDWMLALIRGLRAEIGRAFTEIKGASGDIHGPNVKREDEEDYYGFLDFLGFLVKEQGLIEAAVV